MKKIKVLIVDDHTLVRDGLIALLKLESDIQIVGGAADGLEALEKIKNMEVDVVLMDIIMKGMDGLEATRLIKEQNDKIEVILLSMEANEEFIAKGIGYGAKAYLPKDISRSKLLEAIRSVSSGEKYFSDKISQLIFESFDNKSKNKATPANKLGQNLSKREKEIMILITNGKTTQDIAEGLFISTKTVDAHCYNILQKLELKNSVELIRYAIKNGMVEV
jgi:DNA-binding NarL/FixJ family response regulator